jgi:hypothetical protein
MQLLMWSTIGLVFGALTERAWANPGSRLANGPPQGLGATRLM